MIWNDPQCQGINLARILGSINWPKLWVRLAAMPAHRRKKRKATMPEWLGDIEEADGYGSLLEVAGISYCMF